MSASCTVGVGRGWFIYFRVVVKAFLEEPKSKSTTTQNHGFRPVEIRENGWQHGPADRIAWRFWLSLAVYPILRPPEHAIGG